LPAPTSDFASGDYKYDLVLKMNGQTMPMTMSRTVKEDNGNWVVTDKFSSPQGDGSDEAIYTKGTLQPKSRKASQGPMTISYTYASNKVTMEMGGKSNSAKIDGAYIHDGGGNDMRIGRLPLKEGYEVGIYV